MSQTMKDEAYPVYSMYTQTCYISNEFIETFINVSNLYARLVKSVNLNQC